MRTRAKFTKQGHVKFVGHLDTVRLFQRAIKVVGIPIAYSQGFNPHSLIYFAMPLSVGVSSVSEYIDIVTSTDVNPEEIMDKLNQVLPQGIQILDAYQVEDKSPTLMSLVDEADYMIVLPKKDVSEEKLISCKTKLEAETIVTLKKGKKKTTEVDLKPLIKGYSWEETEEEHKLLVKVAAGSKENLSPELLLKAITENECNDWNYQMERQGLYTFTEEGIVSLDHYGRINL